MSRKTYALLLLLLFGLGGISSAPALAAKKYYPPGYAPPSEHKPVSVSEPPVVVIPSPPQVIIKTVPVVKPVQKDPLLVLLDERRYFEALRLVDSRLKKSPNSSTLQLIRGGIYKDAGNYSQAISQYQSVYGKNRLKGVRAQALAGQGWTYYRKAVQEKQNSTQQAFDTSAQKSIALFKQSILLLPASADAWAGLARVQLLTSHTVDAEHSVKKALQLAPSSLSSQLANAELLLSKKKTDDALQVLYGLKKNTTHEPDVFLLLAKASLEADLADDAIINLKQLLEFLPEHTEALKLLSRSYEVKMMPQDAEQVLQKAVSINPSDQQSVEALLKMYDQKGEHERGLLLLKTLVKNRPDQIVYAKQILLRLSSQYQWEDAYKEGLGLLSGVWTDESVSDADKRELAHRFSQVIYHHANAHLNSQPVMDESVVKELQSYLKTAISDGIKQGKPVSQEYVDLLFLYPLQPMQGIKLTEFDELPVRLQIAYLSGSMEQYHRVLSQIEQQPELRLTAARRLSVMGNNEDALHLLSISKSSDLDAKMLQQKLQERQQKLQEHLSSIEMLPKKIPDAYFQNAANEVLTLGVGNWKAHAALAKALEKRHETELAYRQQLLAAHFAVDVKDQSYWQKKAEKTGKSLKKN